MRFMLFIVCGAFVMSSAGDTWAAERRRGSQDSSRRIRTVTFNVFCKYKGEHGSARFKTCFAGARFEKEVWWNGKEIEDHSEFPYNPVFEVECDGDTIYNEGGRRFTDDDGTRIQGESGPYPAIVLPPGALNDGKRSVGSHLELRDDFSDDAYKGSCQIYTGNP